MNSFSPSDVKPRLESRELNQIADWLRKVDSETRVFFLTSCIGKPGPIVRLAKSVVNKPQESFQIFRSGLASITSPNSTATKQWLEFGVAKLGVRKAIRVLREFMEHQSHVVDMGLYWLPTLIQPSDAGYAEFLELRKKAEEKDIIRPSVSQRMPNGTVVYSDCYADWRPLSP